MSRQWLAVATLAWVLWVDQTAYGVPSGPGDGTPLLLEGASARWEQLAVTATRAECRALRRARTQAAAQADKARDDDDIAKQGRRIRRYRDQYRYFCSPLDPAR